MDDSTFGPLTALSHGLVVQKKDGGLKNVFVVFDNGGISEQSSNANYPTKVPAGKFAFRACKYFTDSGIVIRLDGSAGDEFNVVVQDNLIDNDFDKFACIIMGHVVEN